MSPFLDARRGGIIVTGFSALFIAAGVNFSFNLFIAPLSGEFGWSRGEISLAAALNLVIYGASQLLYGRMIDLYGPRRVMGMGAALAGLGNLMMSTTNSLGGLYLFYGIISSLGFTGLSILPVSILILREFERRRGLALGVTATGFSLGQALFYQIAEALITSHGWRFTYIVFGLLLMSLLPACLLLIKDTRTEPQERDTPAASGSEPSLRRALIGREFLAISGAYFACGFTDFMVSVHLAVFALDQGLTSLVAARALSLMALANVVGLLIAGRASDIIGNRSTLVMIYLLRASSLVLLLFVSEEPALYTFSILFGLTFFTTAPLTSGLVNRVYGAAISGAVFGAAGTIHHLGGGLGSYAAGVVFDLYGSYLPIFALGVLLALSAAGLMIVLARLSRGPI